MQTDVDRRRPFRPVGATAAAERSFYDVAYSAQRGDPDWTLHCLTPGRTVKRFHRDGTPVSSTLLGLPFSRDNILCSPLPDEYLHCAYDKGHMVPCEAMQFDLVALRESFLMSNVCPQRPGLNRGPWRTLEMKCFTAARQGLELVIIAGPVYLQEGRRIGSCGPSIPDAFFKIAAVPAEKAIACYVMPNSEHVDGSLEAHYVSIAKVAHLTQLEFPAFAGWKENPALLDPRPSFFKLDETWNRLQIENLMNGEYVLLAPYLFNPCDKAFPRARLRILAGFPTDFGSTGAARGIYPPIGTFRDQCFLGHDAYYAAQYPQWEKAYKVIKDSGAARAESDWRLLESLQAAGDAWFNRNAIWSAVKLGGGSTWRKHTPESIAAARCLIETVEVP